MPRLVPLGRSSIGLLVLVSLAAGGCSRRVEEPPSESRLTAAATPAPPPSASATAGRASAALVQPTPILTLPSSAYQAALFMDAAAVELLTSSAAYHLVPGKEPLRQALDLGFGATVTKQNYIYWSNGAVWSAPRRGPSPSGPSQIQKLSHRPQRFVSDIKSERIAFLDHGLDDRDSIRTLQSAGDKTLYPSPGSIDALTLIGDAVYFVERPDSDGWRIGRVPLSGAPAVFTARKAGRWPAMLSGQRELVYYDGKTHRVLALSLDLQRERPLASDLICSPLAAEASVYCAAMSGVFEVPAEGKPRQVVAANHLVTGLSTSSEQLAFLMDVGGRGQDQLAVQLLPVARATSP